jgi:hypothetical protein
VSGFSRTVIAGKIGSGSLIRDEQARRPLDLRLARQIELLERG